MARVVIATEGPASEAVLRTICKRLNVDARVFATSGKARLFQDFPRIFSVQASAKIQIVAPDLHPEVNCIQEAARWRRQVASHFPKARVCLAIWESESWLLADPTAVERVVGGKLAPADPERVGAEKPSEVLEQLARRARGYRKGAAFDKQRDGVKIVEAMDLKAAERRSASLRRFISLVHK